MPSRYQVPGNGARAPGPTKKMRAGVYHGGGGFGGKLHQRTEGFPRGRIPRPRRPSNRSRVGARPRRNQRNAMTAPGAATSAIRKGQTAAVVQKKTDASDSVPAPSAYRRSEIHMTITAVFPMPPNKDEQDSRTCQSMTASESGTPKPRK